MGNNCCKRRKQSLQLKKKEEKKEDLVNFDSCDELIKIIRRRAGATIPYAISSGYDDRIEVKSHYFANTYEILENLKASIETDNRVDVQAYYSEDDKKNKLNITSKTLKFRIKEKEDDDSDNSVTYGSHLSNTIKGKIYSKKIIRGNIEIPKNSIKIYSYIEEEVEKILFDNSDLSLEERYNRYLDLLQNYGEIIPLKYVIGAKIDISYETKEYQEYSGTGSKINSLLETAEVNSNFLSEFKNKKSNYSLSFHSKGFKGGESDVEHSTNLLDKNHYDIIDVDDFHDLHEFFNKNLRDRVEDWLNNIDERFKLKRKLIKLLNQAEYNEDISYDSAKGKTKWNFGADVKDFKKSGIEFEEKTLKFERKRGGKFETGLNVWNIGVELQILHLE